MEQRVLLFRNFDDIMSCTDHNILYGLWCHVIISFDCFFATFCTCLFVPYHFVPGFWVPVIAKESILISSWQSQKTLPNSFQEDFLYSKCQIRVTLYDGRSYDIYAVVQILPNSKVWLNHAPLFGMDTETCYSIFSGRIRRTLNARVYCTSS